MSTFFRQIVMRFAGIAFSLGLACAPVAAQAPACGVEGTDVLSLAAELSGPEYAGRLIGTPGGVKAGDLLAARLRDAGYSVSFIEFTDRVIFMKGQPLLEILDGAGVRESMRYRVDFKESMSGGWEGGTIAGPLLAVDSPPRTIRTEEGSRLETYPEGSILLISASVYNKNFDEKYLEAGAKGIIYELTTQSLAIRAMAIGQPLGTLVAPKRGLVKMAVSTEAFSRLQDAAKNGYRAKIVNPGTFRDVAGRTIVASLNGDGKKFTPKIALVAHYDHVGTDPDGSYFPGALDNASGASLVTDIAAAIARTGIKADFAVILTDGEEVGLSGAAAFSGSPSFRLPGTAVINLDMVGSSADLPFDVSSTGDRPSVALAESVAALLKSAGFRAELNNPNWNADHAPFARAGAAAVSVTERDFSAYHTTADRSETLSADELGRLGKAFSVWILGRLR